MAAEAAIWRLSFWDTGKVSLHPQVSAGWTSTPSAISLPSDSLNSFETPPPPRGPHVRQAVLFSGGLAGGPAYSCEAVSTQDRQLKP